MFQRLSIHNKLSLAIGVAILAACVLAITVMLLFESHTLDRRARDVMEPYARLVTVGTEVAVKFQDSQRALEILNTLRTNPEILEAEIRLENGELLASYSSTTNTTLAGSPIRPDGVYLQGDTAEMIQSLGEGAHLRLIMSLNELTRETRNAVLVFAAGLFLLLLVINLGLRVILQRIIVGPLSTLDRAVRQVRTRADYQQRVPASGTDEVARLGQSFNAMMGVIQERQNDLRALTRFQRTLLDSAAYGIISTAPDGTVSSFNPAAERLLGYQAGEVIGKKTPLSWHDPEEVTRRAQQLSEKFGEVITPSFHIFTARPRRNLPEEDEWTFIRKDGTRVPVLLSVTALRGEDGQIVGFLGLTHDLTERKKTEGALKEKTEELDGYFTHTLDLLCIADTDGYFRRLNREWETTLGYSIAELEGQHFLDFVHPDDQEATMQVASRLAAQGEVLNFVNRYRCRDGTYRWLEWRAFPSGKRVYAVARDITERKRSEEEIRALNQELDQRVKDRTAQLEAANQELESFSYSVSHDLRAPVRSIEGLCMLLDDYSAALGPDGKVLLQRIVAATQKMSDLIDDMLRLSHINRSEMHWTVVNLSRIAEEIAAELKRSEPGRQGEFLIEPDCVVNGDPGLLSIALENILGNAWKYTGKRPVAKIEFGTLQTSEGTVYFVRDNGCGFDMQHVHKLFGTFQRLHSARDFPGTGIGLVSVQRVIQRHGGRVWIEGKVDVGTTLYFVLPQD